MVRRVALGPTVRLSWGVFFYVVGSRGTWRDSDLGGSELIYVDGMTRSHFSLVATLLVCLTLSACSADNAPSADGGHRR